MLDTIVFTFVGEAVRSLGWLLLKCITLWRYSGMSDETLVFEGAAGLTLIAGILWVLLT